MEDAPTAKHEAPEIAAQDMTRPKIRRRYGACGPCRLGKTKCDGKQPCTTCRQERRRTKICEYTNTSVLRTTAQPRASKTKARRKPSSPARVTRPTLSATREGKSDCPGSTSREYHPDFPSAHSKQRDMSLHQEIDEMIRIQSTRGRVAQPIDRIRRLWSDLQDFMKSSSANTCPEEDHGGRPRDTNSSLATTEDGALQSPTKTAPARDFVIVWRERLDTIGGLIIRGKLMQAWTEVATMMPMIKSYEFEHRPLSQKDEAVLHFICIHLVELECALSFFTVGGSHLSLWSAGGFSSVAIEKEKSENVFFATNLEMYETIQQVLDIDTSTDRGVQEFVQAASNIKKADSTTQLDKLALGIQIKEPVGKQELKLITNLFFMIMHCRKVLLCVRYAERDIPNCSLSKAIKSIKKGPECDQAIKYAGAVLEAFESLCDIDATNTAKCWLRPYGALMAGMLIGIESLRANKTTSEVYKKPLHRLLAWFETLDGLCSSNSILKKATAILEEYRPEKQTLTQTKKAAVSTEYTSQNRKRGYEAAHGPSELGTHVKKHRTPPKNAISVVFDPIMSSKCSEVSSGSRKPDDSPLGYPAFLPPRPPVSNDPRETESDLNKSFVSCTSTVPVDLDGSFCSSVSGMDSNFHHTEPNYTPQQFSYVHPWANGPPRPPMSIWHAPLALQASDIPLYATQSYGDKATSMSSISSPENARVQCGCEQCQTQVPHDPSQQSRIVATNSYHPQQSRIPDEPIFPNSSFPPPPARMMQFPSPQRYQNAPVAQVPDQDSNVSFPSHATSNNSCNGLMRRNSTPIVSSPYQRSTGAIWHPSILGNTVLHSH